MALMRARVCDACGIASTHHTKPRAQSRGTSHTEYSLPSLDSTHLEPGLSACFEEEDRRLARVEVNMAMSLVRHKGAKVPPDDAVPHALVLVDKAFAHVLSNLGRRATDHRPAAAVMPQ